MIYAPEVERPVLPFTFPVRLSTSDLSEQVEESKRLDIVTGLPYSGKSTFADYWNRDRDYLILDSNSLGISFRANLVKILLRDDLSERSKIQSPEELNEKVIADTFQAYSEALKEKFRDTGDIILDTEDFMDSDGRRYFLNKMSDVLGLEIDLYWMDTELDECLRRRDSGDLEHEISNDFSKEEIRDMYLGLVKPTTEEGFNNVYSVRGISPLEFEIIDLSKIDSDD